jgi:glycerophosphoryl diester phosphodiesterase
MFDLRQQKNGRPLLVGHRGAMDVAPENTMVSFEAG